MNQENSNIPHNEIDEIITVIKTYRILISLVSILFVILAVVYAFWIQKPIYSASAMVQIAKINARLIEPSAEVETKWAEKYEIYINPNKEIPKISEIKTLKRTNGIIQLTALAYDKKSLKNYLTREIKKLSQEHNIYIKEYTIENNVSLTQAEKNLKLSLKEFKKIKIDIKSNEVKFDKLTNNDQALINMYLIKMLKNDVLLERTSKRIAAYRSQIKKYKKYLQEKRTFNTHIVNHIVIKSKPITASKWIIITVGLVSGILFSLLLSFFLSFIVSKRD